MKINIELTDKESEIVDALYRRGSLSAFDSFAGYRNTQEWGSLKEMGIIYHYNQESEGDYIRYKLTPLGNIVASQIGKEINDSRFLNGFRSWVETHHEIVCMITLALHEQTVNQKLVKVLYDKQQQEGSCGMYTLAKEWTDEFEGMNEGRKWDGEFFEEVEAFAKKKMYGS